MWKNQQNIFSGMQLIVYTTTSQSTYEQLDIGPGLGQSWLTCCRSLADVEPELAEMLLELADVMPGLADIGPRS